MVKNAEHTNGTETQGQEAVASLSPSLPARFVPVADADSLADALVAGQLSPRTRKAYASDLAELLTVLESWSLTLENVNRDHLHAYRSWLAGEEVPGLVQKEPPCAPATVSRKVSVVRQFFTEALDRGLIAVNPAARLRGFTLSPESKTRGLTKPQTKELLESIETKTLLGLRDKAMLCLMLRTGLRRMDVIGATVGALGEREGHTTLTVLSKGHKERTVKIPVDVARLLDAWREGARQFRDEVGTTPLFIGLVKHRGKPVIAAASRKVAGVETLPLLLCLRAIRTLLLSPT